MTTKAWRQSLTSITHSEDWEGRKNIKEAPPLKNYSKDIIFVVIFIGTSALYSLAAWEEEGQRERKDIK